MKGCNFAALSLCVDSDVGAVLTMVGMSLIVNSMCWMISCSSRDPRFSWFLSTGAFRQRANFSRAALRHPAFRSAMPHACHTPLGSRPVLVDT